MTAPNYEIPVISRKEATERGLNRYFTGKPCKNGHMSESTIRNGCMECSRIRGAKYKKKLSADPKYRKRMALKGREKYHTLSSDERKALARQRASYHREYQRKNAACINKNHRDRYRAKKAILSAQHQVYQRQYYYQGPVNPKGEKQWLKKNLAQLRSVKRLLKRLSQGLPPSPSSAFTMPTGSPQ